MAEPELGPISSVGSLSVPGSFSVLLLAREVLRGHVSHACAWWAIFTFVSVFCHNPNTSGPLVHATATDLARIGVGV